ncbi:MAG: hypothetical protein Q9183_002402, partial [Haloplaca sp. 2 TL-2023]
MRQQALLGYSDVVLDYDFHDVLFPNNRVRIIMTADVGALFGPKVVRSTVMWAINRVITWMMASDCLRKISFSVYYRGDILYTGMVTTIDDPLALSPPHNASVPSPRGSISPAYLVSIPTNSTTVVLRNLGPLDHDPQYELSFQFLPTRRLNKYNIYQALLALLLEEGKADAESTQQQISLSRREYKAWIFMMQSHLPMRGKDLR